MAFRGRHTLGHKTIIMAGAEFDWNGKDPNTRKETGRCFLVVIKDKSKETFEEVIRHYVYTGSFI